MLIQFLYRNGCLNTFSLKRKKETQMKSENNEFKAMDFSTTNKRNTQRP